MLNPMRCLNDERVYIKLRFYCRTLESKHAKTSSNIKKKISDLTVEIFTKKLVLSSSTKKLSRMFVACPLSVNFVLENRIGVITEPVPYLSNDPKGAVERQLTTIWAVKPQCCYMCTQVIEGFEQ